LLCTGKVKFPLRFDFHSLYFERSMTVLERSEILEFELQVDYFEIYYDYYLHNRHSHNSLLRNKSIVK